MDIPWRRVRRWECLECGKCCKAFLVPVRIYERPVLEKRRPGSVTIAISREGRRGLYLSKKESGECIFLVKVFGRYLCSIQDIKPVACRLYPFRVKKYGSEEAYLRVDGEDVYVYLDGRCPGVKEGKADLNMYNMAVEAARLKINSDRLLERLRVSQFPH